MDNKRKREDNYKWKKENGGKKPNSPRGSKSQDKPSFDDRRGKRFVDPANDWSWYVPTDQTARDVGSFSFNKPIGQVVNGGYSISNAYSNQHFEANTPGVAVLRLAHTIGAANSDNDAVNVMAKNVYSYVRHANSGHANYDGPDLVMYLLAAADAYSAYAWMVRLYGCMNVFNSKNRYLPKTLIRAMNVDYDDIQAHLNDLRTFINITALRLSSLYIPNTMKYFVRRYWLYSNIYADSSDPKAQLYLYNPAYFWHFDATTESTGSSLRPTFIDSAYAPYNGAPANTVLKYSDIITKINALLDPMIGNEDIGIMAGDILKAYGADKMLTVSQIAENYVVVPSYNEEVLTQIHNARCADKFWDLQSLLVKQTASGTIQNPIEIDCGTQGTMNLGVLSKKFAHDLYLNMHKDVVTPEDVLVATRLQWFVGGEASIKQYSTVNHEVAKVWTCGTEIPLTLAIYCKGWGGKSGYTSADTIMRNVGTEHVKDVTSATTPVTFTQTGVMHYSFDVAAIMQFDWFPLYYVLASCDVGPGYDVTDWLFVNGDVDNYRVMTFNDIMGLHTAALFGLFGVPQHI